MLRALHSIFSDMTKKEKRREDYFPQNMADWISSQEIKDICKNYEMSGIENLENINLSDEARSLEINKIRVHRFAAISMAKLANDIETENAAFEFFQLNWIESYNVRKLYIYVDKNEEIKVNPITLLEIAVIKWKNPFIVSMMGRCKINLLYHPSIDEENIERQKNHSPLKVIILSDLFKEEKFSGFEARFMDIIYSMLEDKNDDVLYSRFKNKINWHPYNINSPEFLVLLDIVGIFSSTATQRKINSFSRENEEDIFSNNFIYVERKCLKKIEKNLEEINQNTIKKVIKIARNIVGKITYFSPEEKNMFQILEKKFKDFRDVTSLLYVNRSDDGIWHKSITSEIQLKILGYLFGLDFENPNKSKEKNDEQRKFVNEQRQIILSKKKEIVKEK